MKPLTRELRRRLCHPEWARRIDDPVHEELQAIADHRLALDPDLERLGNPSAALDGIRHESSLVLNGRRRDI